MLGIRLGASLALRHQLERGGIERLVLWDPVVKGQDFVDAVRAQSAKHEQWLVECHGARPASVPADGALDLLGFRYSNTLIDELAALDLLALDSGAGTRTYILDNCEDAATATLAEHLQGIGFGVQLQRFEAPKVWMHEPYQGLLSAESLKLVEAWISGGENE